MIDIKLSDRVIGLNHPLFFIAEAGVNHNGSIDLALKLVDAAANAGADAVKFQTFKAENLITQTAPKAPYHLETTGGDDIQSWYELLKTQELSADMHIQIIKRCKEKGIVFLSTPYDEESVDLLDELNVDLFKVASTDTNNIPFLEYIASKKRPMILSTAMSTLDEVKESIAAIRNKGANNLIVMQCTGSYPAPIDQANIRAMVTIREACNVLVGFSDHTPGFEAAITAQVLGACVYEKHFTLDQTLPGPDHRSSLEPNELINLIKSLKLAEYALGDGIKRVMPCETINRTRLRKSILSRHKLNSGHKIKLEDLVFKRAGGLGLPPNLYHEIIGKPLKKPLAVEEPITLAHLNT